MPKRIQMSRRRPWRAEHPDAVIVDRRTKWGNPFRYRDYRGLVRYQPSAPEDWEYEGRISADGQRHDFYGPDGSITEFWVRYATRAELVELYRRTLLEPDRGMQFAYPSRKGHFARVTVEDIRAELAGRDLACWCNPFDPCHVDVLLEIANGQAS